MSWSWTSGIQNVKLLREAVKYYIAEVVWREGREKYPLIHSLFLNQKISCLWFKNTIFFSDEIKAPFEIPDCEGGHPSCRPIPQSSIWQILLLAPKVLLEDRWLMITINLSHPTSICPRKKHLNELNRPQLAQSNELRWTEMNYDELR